MRLPVGAPGRGHPVLRPGLLCWANGRYRAPCDAPATERLCLCREHEEELLG